MTNSLVAAASAAELLVYLQVTRGMEYGRNHLFPPASVEPTGFAFVSPYPQPAQALLERGLAAVTLDDTRWARCDIKSVALLANVLLRQEAQDKGGSEAILTRDGRVTEGSSSTVFIVRDGKLVTPPNDHSVLPGTSRDAVLELATGWLPVEIRTFGVDELRRRQRGLDRLRGSGRAARSRRWTARPSAPARRAQRGARCMRVCSSTSTR